ncbi:hypothetical protein Tco_0359796 [Tanacetum coccineum]
MEPASAEVLDDGSDDLNGGIVVVEEVVKWCGGSIYGEVVGERMVQNPWVLLEGVFGRCLEKEFVIVDWNFSVVDHLRKLSRDVVLVSVLGNFLGGFWVDELAFEAMRYGDQRWDKRRLFAGFGCECWFDKDKLLLDTYLGIRENIRYNMRNLLVKEFEECERDEEKSSSKNLG